ncbi:MAG: aldo/keto reductase [Anaerolineae bacterium]
MMDRRVLGRTGCELSVIGFGGILVMNETPAESQELVSLAVDAGINYFDVAPSYGNAEERLGPALEPYRQNIFLACKTAKRDAQGAREELEGSLERLRTDYFDLYQLHGVTSMEEVETIFGPDGAMDTFLEAREEGLVRFLGFSAHSEEAAIALLNRFPFDSVLFPLSWVPWHEAGFGPKVIETAQAKGAGRLALKALAKCKWESDEARKEWPKCWYRPVETLEEARLALRFTLSLPVTAAVTPGHRQFLEWAIEIAEDLTPLSEEEQRLVAENAKGLAPIFPQS